MKSFIGHIRLTHISDGVLHGDIIPLHRPACPVWAIAEFDLSKPKFIGLRLSTTEQGMFGLVHDPSDVPIAYPRKTGSWEITPEILEQILVNAKQREQEGWLAPVWLD